MFHIVLVEPEIPQNTGNIARTCAATGCKLHLVEPLGFQIDEKQVRRAGLDYWDSVEVCVHPDLSDLFESIRGARLHFFTTKARKRYDQAVFREGDALIFGKETRGLDEELLKLHKEECVRIPMISEIRSLNLSNAAAIAVYEAFRQNDFRGLNSQGELHRLRWDE